MFAVLEADAVQVVPPLFAALVAASGAEMKRECVQVAFIENSRSYSSENRRKSGQIPIPFLPYKEEASPTRAES
jgi:hypothetical protein